MKNWKNLRKATHIKNSRLPRCLQNYVFFSVRTKVNISQSRKLWCKEQWRHTDVDLSFLTAINTQIHPQFLQLSKFLILRFCLNWWACQIKPSWPMQLILEELKLGSTKLTANLVRLWKHFLDTRIILFRKKFILLVIKNHAVDGEIKRSAKIIFWFLSSFSYPPNSMFNVDLSFNRKSKSP